MSDKKVTRRGFLKGVAVAAGSGVLASCAPQVVKETVIVEKVITATPEPKVKPVVKITHWQHISPPNPVYAELVRRFNEKQKGQIEVEMQVIPWDAFHQTLITVIAAGSAPDAIRLPASWFGEFWKAKWVLPLDDYIEKWDGRVNFSDANFDARRGGPGQPVLCLPHSSVASLLYYRRDWFEEEGIEVPTTMDEFLEACKAIARPNENRWGYAVRGARGGDQLHNWIIYAFGGRWVDDGGNVVIDSPEAVAGAEFLVDLRRKWEVCRPDSVTDGWAELSKGVTSGEIAMMNHGVHIRSILTDALGDKIAPAKLPTGKSAGTWQSVSGPAILSGTEYPDECWEWAKFWGSEEAAEMFIEVTEENMVPENKLLADHPKFKEDPYYKVTAEMQKVPDYTPNWHPRYGSLTEKIWSPTFQQALLGEITPQEMMETYADYMRETG